MAGIFGAGKDMAGVTPYGRGRFAVPGTYALELKALTVKASQDPKKKGHNILIGEFSILNFEGARYVSFLDGSVKDTREAYRPGESISEIVDTDDAQYGMANSKELCAAVKHAYERQRNNREGYSIDEAMRELSNDEANGWVLDPSKNKELIGLAFTMEAWNVVRTNSQTKKPDDFTAKKLLGV